MVEQITNFKKIYFLISSWLIIISSIQILGAEPISKGKWQGKGAPSVAPIKISFRVLNQASLDSIIVSYHTYNGTDTATASTGIIQAYRNFYIIATGW